MKKVQLMAVVVCLLASVSAFAADEPKAEVFAGYQFTHLDGGGVIDNANASGWNGALTGYVNKWLGVTADLSGAYTTVSGVKLKTHTYTFGPTVALRNSEKLTPFVHALFGGAHASGSAFGASASDSAFAMILGGGVDAKFSDRLAFRVAQFDLVSLRSNGDTSNKNFRLSTGVVFRF